MRTFLLLACGFMPTFAGAAEPAPLPLAQKSKLEHLRAAAENLQAAGLPEQATQILADAERFQKETTDALSVKREKVAVLPEEIRQLERELGQAKTLQIKVLALEFDPAAMPEIRQAAGVEEGAPLVILTAQQRQDIDRVIKRLEAEKKAKIAAETTLVTNDGRPATMFSGGEFPVVTPTKGETPAVTYRSVGTRLETLPNMINSDRLSLDIAYEESNRDASSVVSLNGQIVPGVSQRRVNTQVEMKLGETVVCGGFHLIRGKSSSDLGQAVRQAAATAIELASGEAVEHAAENAEDRVYLVLVTPETFQPAK